MRKYSLCRLSVYIFYKTAFLEIIGFSFIHLELVYCQDPAKEILSSSRLAVLTA